jgi:transcriptional regulator with XRE-family HTH domain
VKIRSTKIVEARLEEGLSQAYLAKRIGTSQPSLSRVERGKTLIAQSTEDRVVALIHRLGELRRTAAVAEKKLAACVSVPMRVSHRKARA